VTWQCSSCQLSGKTLPTFTLQSSRPSWANAYGFNFTTPVFATESGTLYDARLVSQARVSQIMFPTPTDGSRSVEPTAFRRSNATQRVTLLLTASQLTDERNNKVDYTAYQPSVELVVRISAILVCWMRSFSVCQVSLNHWLICSFGARARVRVNL
jgi:hypothetical protein